MTNATFGAVEALLPNGFHDAFLLSINVNYVRREAWMHLEVWVANSECPDYPLAGLEAYRQIRLTFTGLLLFAAEIPNGEYLDEKPHGLQFDVAYGEQAEEEKWPDEPLPSGHFRRTFYFTQDFNSRVRIAASDVTLEWLTEPRVIY